jgi:hypothetical protein
MAYTPGTYTPDGRDANNTVDDIVLSVKKATTESIAGSGSAGVSSVTDPRRVRLGAKPKAASQIYGSTGLLQPLINTNGLVWPYQPTIAWTQAVNYSASDTVHSIQEFKSFVRNSAPTFGVDGQFSVQNQADGIYCLACIHFLRVVTKMYFGQSINPGTPPPVLEFSAYGQYMFNRLPVIVESFSVSLPADVDYIPIDMANVSNTQVSSILQVPSLNQDLSFITKALIGQSNLNSSAGYVWLPSLFNISVNLTVQNTPQRIRSFDLEKFRTGDLLKDGRWS